jgi:hypothetical protein
VVPDGNDGFPGPLLADDENFKQQFRNAFQFRINPADTQGHVYKIIDFGRSRALFRLEDDSIVLFHPKDPPQFRFFFPKTDIRYLALRIIEDLPPQRILQLHESHPVELDQFGDVLKNMLDWKQFVKEEPNVVQTGIAWSEVRHDLRPDEWHAINLQSLPWVVQMAYVLKKRTPAQAPTGVLAVALEKFVFTGGQAPGKRRYCDLERRNFQHTIYRIAQLPFFADIFEHIED